MIAFVSHRPCAFSFGMVISLDVVLTTWRAILQIKID